MAEVLVLVEHDGGAPKKVTGELLTLARRLGEPSAVFLGAEGTFEKAKNYLAEYGAQKVYVGESNDLEDYLVAPKAEALAQVISSSLPAAVLVAATPDAREAGARAAVKTNSGFLGAVTDLAEGGKATQEIFGGTTIVTSEVAKGTPIFAVRPNATAAEPATGAATEERIELSVSDSAQGRRGGRPPRRVQDRSPRPHRSGRGRLRWPWPRRRGELRAGRKARRHARC